MSRGNEPLATKRRPDWAALVIAICLFVVAAVMLWDASHMRAIAQYDRIGPATAPKVVAFGLIGLGIWTIFEAWRGEFPDREHQEIAPVVWVVAGLAAQMLLLKTAGFSIATGLLFAFTAAGFGRRKLWISIPAGIAFSFVVWVIFAKLLQLTLPAGPFEHMFF